MALRSFIFSKDPVFERCLLDHAAHIVPGSRGPHVRKIIGALNAIDGSPIDDTEWKTSTFGPATAQAVLDFKVARDIINRSYQQTADNIVGKMTIDRLDREMAALEVKAKPAGQSRCELEPEPSSGKLRALAIASGIRGIRPVAFRQAAEANANRPVQRSLVGGKTAPVQKPVAFITAPRKVTIDKVGAPPRFGSDGFDDIARFQMVPVNRTRQFTVSSSSVPCSIEIESGRSFARFVNIRDREGRFLEPDFSKVVTVITLPPNTFVAFSLLGISQGLGQVVARSNGKPDDTLTFSVKEPQSKSVAIWLVSDNLSRSTSMTADRAGLLLKRSSDFFVAWTNTALTMVGRPTPIVVPVDLLDPIDMRKGSSSQLRIVENHVFPFNAKGVKADIHLFYTWDLKDYTDRNNELFGITAGSFCFVESTDKMPENVDVTLTSTHELGHALGLDHNSRRDSLMHVDTFHILSRMLMDEINTVNATGLSP